MRILLAASAACLLTGFVLASNATSAQLSSTKPPETFLAEARVTNEDAGQSATVTIRINKYITDKDRMTMEEALRVGGFPGFLPVLRKSPEVGSIEMAGRKVVARWARQQPKDKGRTISVVADEPLFFVGGGKVDAKPRSGYELAIVLLDVDVIGLGSGTMAPAARVRPGGDTGVEIDEYGDKPVRLVTVRKAYK